jgi:hypothetical protein
MPGPIENDCALKPVSGSGSSVITDEAGARSVMVLAAKDDAGGVDVLND